MYNQTWSASSQGRRTLSVRYNSDQERILTVPFIIFALLFSLPPINSRNSDPGSHSRLFSPPYLLRFVPCIFIARKFQLFLPSSTRVELCLPTLGGLSSSSFFILFLHISPKPRHGGIRTHGPTLVTFECHADTVRTGIQQYFTERR